MPAQRRSVQVFSSDTIYEGHFYGVLDDSLTLLAAPYLQIAGKAKRRNLILLHTNKHGTMTRTALK